MAKKKHAGFIKEAWYRQRGTMTGAPGAVKSSGGSGVIDLDVLYDENKVVVPNLTLESCLGLGDRSVPYNTSIMTVDPGLCP